MEKIINVEQTDLGKKRRVFQVARELSLSNEAVIDFLGKMDKSIRTQMSSVSNELYEKICNMYKSEATPAEGSSDLRQQIKERQMLEELRRNKAKMELEERIRFATQLAEERPQRLRKTKELQEEKQRLQEEAKAAAQEAAEKETQEGLSVVEMISKAKKEIEEKEKAAAQASGVKETKKTRTKKVGEAEIADKDSAIEQVGEEQEAAAITEDAAPVEAKAGTEKKDAEKPAAGTETTTGNDKQKRKGKKKKKRRISEEEIQANIRQTLAKIGEVKSKRRRKRSKAGDGDEFEEDVNIIKVSEFVSVAELADILDVGAGEVLTKCLELGLMVSINQRLDMDAIEAVADEFEYEVEKIEEYGAELIDKYEETEADREAAVHRPPVVTIMGHVDHGKTSLLDFIRKSNIISGEAGGITQHIGAYEVSFNGKEITFLDTPGHEAFTAMRARGAQITDLVVLVVAADDGVQPQTVEAINHALAAGVPLVVAINKVDKPNANPEMIKKQLGDQNILVEEWGGKYQTAEISAKTGQNIDRLMELILLEAEILELKANPDRTARGVVIESKLDKGKGAVATVLVETGTLKVGDLFVAGNFSGKVRALYDERNHKVKAALPAAPVQVIGFDGVPQAGDTFIVMDTESEVREISRKRKQLKREQDFRRSHAITLDQIGKEIKEGRVKELNIVLKADVDGSNEALTDVLMKVSNTEVSVKVIHKAVGGISESDVLLASASKAIIIGFNVRPTVQARELAKKEEIDIRLYDVIYAVAEDIRAALEGMLDPEITDELTSTIEVRETFKVPKVGTIAGSFVVSGKASRSDFARIYRDDKLLYETKISTLKRFKEDVREVQSNFECGICLDGFDDIKVGDVIETYRKIETARKLEA